MLTLRGRLASSAAAALEEAINRSLGGADSLVVDLASVDYLSSRSLGVLQRAAAQCVMKGGALVLAGVTPAVRLAMDLGASNPPISDEPSLDAAVARALGAAPERRP